jgi:hypothetical protein
MGSARLIAGSINAKEPFDFPRINVQEPNTAFAHTKNSI